MYAMSVSPLRKEWLSRISPRLEGLLAAGGPDRMADRGRVAAYSGEKEAPVEAAPEGRRGRKEKEGARGLRVDRDFTNNLKIGSEVFALAADKKKKKVVNLEWAKLKKVREEIDKDDLARYRDMKGTVLFGRLQLLPAEKLDVILKIAPWLDLDRDLKRNWPRKRNFDSKEGIHDLLSSLEHVLQVSVAKEKSSELGFVALFTDTEGNYWFRCSRGFHTALNESIASLEALADELGELATAAEKEAVSALYRKLTSFFE
jgi:hypothetical protein